MKKITASFITIILIFVLAIYAEAELHDRGNGLIYDDYLDITWLQYTNYSGETHTWTEANTWVDELIYQDYNDWRLPSTDTSCSGYNCTDSEMGHLFYIDAITSDSPGLFTDVRPYMYWSETDDDSDTSRAWRFNFSSGYQGTSSKTAGRYAWAVRDGDSVPAVVPEPISSILFITGGVALSARCLYKKKNA